MKTIFKQFDTVKQAEKFLFSLYSKYEHVRLIKAPMFQESGQYWYEVSGKIA